MPRPPSGEQSARFMSGPPSGARTWAVRNTEPPRGPKTTTFPLESLHAQRDAPINSSAARTPTADLMASSLPALARGPELEVLDRV